MTSWVASIMSDRRSRIMAAVLAVAVVLIALWWLRARTPQVAAVPSLDQGIRLQPVLVLTGPRIGDAPRFSKPLGVAFGPRGEIVVSDTGNDRVCIFGPDGGFIREWGGLGVAKPLAGYRATWRPGRLNYPVGVDVTDESLVFVADFRNDQIAVFELDGTPVTTFPRPTQVVGRGGSGQDGRGIAVTDVSVAGRRVFATDTYQIFEFTSDGTYVRQFGRPGTAPEGIDHPAGVAYAGNDTLVVSDSNHQQVTSFTTTGTVQWTVPARQSRDAGGVVQSFGLPRGIAVLPNGWSLVADAVDHTLVAIDRDGAVRDRLGMRGARAGEFNFPADVDTWGDLVVVADKENDRVQVLRMVAAPIDGATSVGDDGERNER